MAKLYKYRIQLSLLFFVGLAAISIYIFGKTSCADGWQSSSIGRSGACSHHGGVYSNIGLLILISALVALLPLWWVSGRYRTNYGYVVKSSLPHHPLEKELSEKKPYIAIKIPLGHVKARQPFECFLCKEQLNRGELYAYQYQFGNRNKFCMPCAEKLPKYNQQSKEDYYKNSRELHFTVSEYYRRHSKNSGSK